MVALKGAVGFCLVKDARTRANKLFMKLSLMVAAIPSLSIQRLECPSALPYPVKCVYIAAYPPAFVELLHGREHALRFGWSMAGLICRV